MICYGPAVLDLSDELADAYGEVFSAPPWNEDEETIRQFSLRLQADSRRAGFRTAFAQSPAGIDGFATGWLTPKTFPATAATGRFPRSSAGSASGNSSSGPWRSTSSPYARTPAGPAPDAPSSPRSPPTPPTSAPGC